MELLIKNFNPPKRQAIKFLIAGIINTLFGYSLYAILIFFGVSFSLALLFSTIAGVIFNFFSFSYMAFSGIRSGWIFLRFVFSYLIVYLVNAIMLMTLISYGGLNPYMSQIICMPFSVALSWILMNAWVYRE
jgi:putative flippase GtrA